MEALFYTLISMDVMEGRDIVICDLPGYFLQIDMEEYLSLHVD